MAHSKINTIKINMPVNKSAMLSSPLPIKKSSAKLEICELTRFMTVTKNINGSKFIKIVSIIYKPTLLFVFKLFISSPHLSCNHPS